MLENESVSPIASIMDLAQNNMEKNKVRQACLENDEDSMIFEARSKRMLDNMMTFEAKVEAIQEKADKN